MFWSTIAASVLITHDADAQSLRAGSRKNSTTRHTDFEDLPSWRHIRSSAFARARSVFSVPTLPRLTLLDPLPPPRTPSGSPTAPRPFDAARLLPPLIFYPAPQSQPIAPRDPLPPPRTLFGLRTAQRPFDAAPLLLPLTFYPVPQSQPTAPRDPLPLPRTPFGSRTAPRSVDSAPL